jgi:hypothetical protein
MNTKSFIFDIISHTSTSLISKSTKTRAENFTKESIWSQNWTIVESYWLTKEWIATAAYLKWMRNSAYYIENLSHSSIYWSFIFWFIEIHLRIEIFVCHENFFFWSSYLRSSLSLRSDFIKIAYSSSNSLTFRQSRKSINLKEIISIEWL